MRTTLNLDAHLLREAKKRAAERGVTLTSVIEDALRTTLTAPRGARPYTFRWSTVKGARAPDVDISDRDALHRWMEGGP